MIILNVFFISKILVCILIDTRMSCVIGVLLANRAYSSAPHADWFMRRSISQYSTVPHADWLMHLSISQYPLSPPFSFA